jgi:hypothetical protein
MKKITKLFFLTAAIVASISMSYAQQATINFETVGNTWSWTTFEGAPIWSVTANPSATGINTSSNVGKMVVTATDARWVGVECSHGNFGPFSLNATNSTIKIMVYKSVISPVGIKLATADGWSQGEIKVSNTKINEWEELSFDFSGFIIQPDGTTPVLDQIVIFPDFPNSDRTAGSVTCFDNISFHPQIITPPTSLATIDYETVGNTWTWTVFGNSAAGGDNPAGLTVPFANPSTTGINTSSSCLKFVEDAGALPWGGFFTENMGPFTISAANCYVKVMVHKDKLSRFGVKFEGATQKEILITNTQTNEWELITFNFTSEIGKTFNKLVLLPDFNETRTSGGTIYIDNISFSDGTTAVKNTYADKTIQVYPTVFKSYLTVKSESEMNQVVVRNLTGQTLREFDMSGLSQKIELSDLISGNYLITVSLSNGRLSTQKIVKL